jgi:hypothetical protein
MNPITLKFAQTPIIGIYTSRKREIQIDFRVSYTPILGKIKYNII